MQVYQAGQIVFSFRKSHMILGLSSENCRTSWQWKTFHLIIVAEGAKPKEEDDGKANPRYIQQRFLVKLPIKSRQEIASHLDVECRVTVLGHFNAVVVQLHSIDSCHSLWDSCCRLGRIRSVGRNGRFTEQRDGVPFPYLKWQAHHEKSRSTTNCLRQHESRVFHLENPITENSAVETRKAHPGFSFYLIELKNYT